jgi:hypothetical protein
LPRHGHVSVVYTTHTELECQMFVERCAAVGTKELAEC